jgi:hypothetical protein
MTAREIRAMLRQRPDAAGECDGCHRETELWNADDRPGDFQMCRRCWTEEATRAKVQGKTIRAQMAVRMTRPAEFGTLFEETA